MAKKHTMMAGCRWKSVTQQQVVQKELRKGCLNLLLLISPLELVKEEEALSVGHKKIIDDGTPGAKFKNLMRMMDCHQNEDALRSSGLQECQRYQKNLCCFLFPMI